MATKPISDRQPKASVSVFTYECSILLLNLVFATKLHANCDISHVSRECLYGPVILPAIVEPAAHVNARFSQIFRVDVFDESAIF